MHPNWTSHANPCSPTRKWTLPQLDKCYYEYRGALLEDTKRVFRAEFPLAFWLNERDDNMFQLHCIRRRPRVSAKSTDLLRELHRKAEIIGHLREAGYHPDMEPLKPYEPFLAVQSQVSNPEQPRTYRPVSPQLLSPCSNDELNEPCPVKIPDPLPIYPPRRFNPDAGRTSFFTETEMLLAICDW